MTVQPPASFVLTDAILFTGDAFVEKQALWVENGRIKDIIPTHAAPKGIQTLSLPDAILAPAYIDCQVNGGGNVLFNNDPTAQGLLTLAAAHRKTGTTRLLPTFITDSAESTPAAFTAIRSARQSDPSILGLHLEGPHISPQFCGIHNPDTARPPDEADMARYVATQDEILVLTLAPDMVPPEQIARLRKQGAIISIGHTMANAAQTRAALAAGATGFTHLFNRMCFMTSRDAGTVGVALDADEAWCGIIGDSHHLADENFRLALRAKPEDKLFFVSDAVAPAGAETPQPFMMGGMMLYPDVQRMLCLNERGVIGGSMMTLGQIVPFAIKERKMAPERALRMASAIPAAFLGLGDRLGKLLPGYGADVVALDHSFRAKAVWRAGEKVV